MIVLVRHPPVAAEGRCYGRLDLPLVDQADAAALAARIGALTGTVWTSPADRCAVVAACLGQYVVDDRLQELDFGRWEGVAWNDVCRAMLDRWAADPWGFSPPGGESGTALVERVRSFAAGLRDGDVVITHGGPLRVLVPLLKGEKINLSALPPRPGTVTVVPIEQLG